MNKKESVSLKGIALLMMIMVHIDSNVSCQFLHYGDFSLWELIHRSCYPVAFFLMLSGYGLRHVYEKGDNHHWGRLIKLFVHYWVIILVFGTIGYFKIGSDIYPGNGIKIIENITSFHTSYNYECWFLFPFFILSASYPIIQKLIDKSGGAILIIAFLLYFASGYIVSHYNLIYKTAPHAIYNILQIFYLSFSFIIGSWLKKKKIFEKISEKANGKKYIKLISAIFIIILLLVRYPITTTAMNPLFALIIFILCWIIIKDYKCPILQIIGKHSMNIWMIHTYFLHYLFHNEIYTLKYTILIFFGVLGISLLCSYIINIITAYFDKQIYNYNI